MIHILENEFLKLSVSKDGAEMHSLIDKTSGKETLWQADPEIWARHAPVLFPIVGKLKDDTFKHHGRTFSLPQHGFARDLEFDLKEATPDKITFTLNSNEETLTKYPFQFHLEIFYALHNNSVSCNYRVTNIGSSEMLFSIGAHPGFVCPMFEDEKLDDYTIRFNKPENTKRELLSNGLQAGDTEPVLDNSHEIRLRSELFSKDAIVFKHLNSDSLELFSGRYQLKFSWYNMPFFGIWTKSATSRFICLEPWAGIADHINSVGELSKKEGIISLLTNQHHECGFSFAPALK